MAKTTSTGVDRDASGVGFVTLVGSAGSERRARLLIESLRAFGGDLAASPIWVFHPSDYGPQEFDRGLERSDGDLQAVPLRCSARSGDYIFGAKVCACAQAEALTGAALGSLVWLSPSCLIVDEPQLFQLDGTCDAAFRIVHHQNVGSSAAQPLDAYWRRVYDAVGLAEAPYTLPSYADRRQLRPYLNTHCFAIRPRLGLCARWLALFEELLADDAFQAGPAADLLHRVFLHQALFSTLVAKEIPRARLRLLPPSYSYPLHMQAEVPVDDRAATLNELVCPVYEEELPLADIDVREPLRRWLAARLPAA
jgi:hypothetical protein